MSLDNGIILRFIEFYTYANWSMYKDKYYVKVVLFKFLTHVTKVWLCFGTS